MRPWSQLAEHRAGDHVRRVGRLFDRVPPPAAPVPPADQAAAGRPARVRVPAFVISPWMPRGTVGHGLYDHTSVLRLIEWRWDLPPLTVRDATANNLADLLDFSHPGSRRRALRARAPGPALPGPAVGPEPLGWPAPPGPGVGFFTG